MSDSRQTYESEEDTKTRHITPAIQAVGWKLDHVLLEYSLKKDRQRIVPGKNVEKAKPSKRSKPDYILCTDVNVPIAVIEAKRKGVPPATAASQAQAYAEMLGVPFAYTSSGTDFYEYEHPWGTPNILPLDKFPSPEELWSRWCVRNRVSKDAEEMLRNASYYSAADSIKPRYYQLQAINNTVNSIIVNGRRRILLVMATGTGKTYTAFQIVWRLKKAGVVKNVLYLADRNQLVDQTMAADFAPFTGMTKIQSGIIDQSYQIYFGLYQQLKGDNAESALDNYKQVPADYFDLIIVDECHRGSAREDSCWREILEYFSSAIQIGMTATPNEKDGSKNSDYFGAPLYTYSLKQGIADGFLAPYRVVSVNLDKDRDGWEPEEGEKDLEGKEIPKRLYTQKDFDSILELRSRTNCVAETVTKYLHHIGRMSKTIVFCNTQRHAATMRDFLREHNKDLVAEEPDYVVRMTADDEDGKGFYQDFISVNRPCPVVVTTSKLLTTGADTKCVKLIVLDSNIKSSIEFKQVIGRGTRLLPEEGKTFFTILDFRGVCAQFSDPEFDGVPDDFIDWSGTEDPAAVEIKEKKTREGDRGDSREVYIVEGGKTSVVAETTSYLDDDGNVVTEKFKDYTKQTILSVYGTEEEFLTVWNGPQTKGKILDELAQHGVSFDQMKKELGEPNLDEFDMIRNIAFGKPLFTRRQRATKVREAKFLEKYQGIARDVLDKLLDAYASIGVREIESMEALKTYCSDLGGLNKLVKSFGGRDAVLAAVRDMEEALYSEAV